MAIAKVENYNGSPAFIIDGKAYPPMMATIRNNDHGTVKIDKEYYRALGKAGIRIFFLICDPLWLIPESLGIFRREAQILLEVCPEAYIIPRISLHPPKEWMESHPDEIVQYADGHIPDVYLNTETFGREQKGMYSLASDVWQKDAGEALLNTVREIEKLPFADRIAGYFLAAGGTSEWYYYGVLEDYARNTYADTSPAFRRYFQKYLDEKYGKGRVAPEIPDLASRFFAEKIDCAIASPGKILAAEPAPPPPSNGTNIGSFLDVNNYMHTFDFYRAWHCGTADSILYFARLLKQRNPDQIVGAFYGSWGWCEQMRGSNTTAALRLLDSGVIDMLANPGVYENRQPGGFTGQRQMPDSFRLRNTLYVVEEDTRTHAENTHFGDLAEMYTLRDTLNVLKRDFGRNLCEDLQAWWFDQHLGGGRYKFPEVYALFEKQQRIAREAYEKDRRKKNEIALLFDEESAGLVSVQTTRDSVEYFRSRELARIGAPVDQYFHNDMADPRMPDYKLYIFMNVYYLSDEERAAIRRKLAANHATALFLYAPGLIDPDKETPLTVENTEELIGMHASLKNDKFSPKFKIVPHAHPIVERLEPDRLYGTPAPQRSSITPMPSGAAMRPSYLYPLICIDDPDATVLATFADRSHPALVIKETEGFTSVFCGAKYLQAEIVREIARFAGCHIYEEEGNVLYASENYLTVHASRTGSLTLRLKAPASPYEVYEERCYGTDTTEIVLSLSRGETKTFELRPPFQEKA